MSMVKGSAWQASSAMGESTGSVSGTRGVDIGEELDTDQDLWWTGVRALLQANEAERRAIEGYLHLVREDFDGSLEDRDVETLIDAAIQNHRRAIDDLELARETVSELRRTQ